MKSSLDNLEDRGFLQKGHEDAYKNLTVEEKNELLTSKIPKERTLGARLLSHEEGSVTVNLIEALKIENKLYPKIEICKALELHKKSSVIYLIKELGNIGTNQHIVLPTKDFGKDSYPLPRDIAARTLANIGKPALPHLLTVLEGRNESQKSEAIDAIGFICFYDYQPNVFETLLKYYSKSKTNNLISWKIIRAMSGFPESSLFLTEELSICKEKRIKQEILRSLRLIEKRIQ